VLHNDRPNKPHRTPLLLERLKSPRMRIDAAATTAFMAVAILGSIGMKLVIV